MNWGLCLVTGGRCPVVHGSSAPEQVACHAAGTRHRLVMEAADQVVGRVPEPLAPAEFDRRHGDMQGVDEVHFQELANGGNPATEWNVVSAKAKLGR